VPCVFEDTKGGRTDGRTRQGGKGVECAQCTPRSNYTPYRSRLSGTAWEKLKCCIKPVDFAPPPPEKKAVSGRRPAAQNRYITSTLYPSKLYLYAMYNDLTIRNGRLVNNRPNDVTGIQQAAQIKKDLKREQKIQMMEEAMYRAEMRADMMESLKEGKKY